MGFFTKYLFLGFFFHLMQQPRWITFIYRQGGSGRGGGGGQGQFDFFVMGGCGGFKTN